MSLVTRHFPPSRPLRLLVWGINYAPEVTGIAPFNTGLCADLRRRGHAVEMVTTFTYYPTWRKQPADRGRLYRTDRIDDVLVHRSWHYVPARVTTLRRIFHEATFALTSFVRLLFLARPDVYIVVSPPLLLGPLASVLGWLKRRPYVFHVQDLQPDAAVGLGMVKVGRFTRALYAVEAWSYRFAARVSGISPGMMAAYARKGVPSAKRVLFPNWLRAEGTGLSATPAAAAAFRRKYDLSASAFVAAYSGNLGKKQGLEVLVEAAARLETDAAPARSIVILIVGDGAMRAELAAQIARRGLRRVRLLPLLDAADYAGLLAAADLSLILQAPGTGQYFFPSKLLSVLAAGSPVLSAADDDSELALAVAEGGFGVNVPTAQPEALAAALKALAADPTRLAALRTATAWVQRFAAPQVLGDYEGVLQAVVDEAADASPTRSS